MPVLSWAHSLFWDGDGAAPVGGQPGYSRWQIVPIMGGSIDEPRERTFWERQAKGLRRFWKEIGRRIPERVWLLWQVGRLLFSPSYSEARRAVRKVAVSEVPREDLGRYIYQRAKYHGKAENLFRNSEARDYTEFFLSQRALRPVRWRQGAAIELAYLALRERGR